MGDFPRVKVCGLTRPEDVALAVEAGADTCGFVHYGPSPRSVPRDELERLTARVPDGVRKVLVLVDPDPEGARQLVRAGTFDWIQLCGAEQPGDWSCFPVPILRRLAADASARPELALWRDVASGFVIDHPSSPGGSGRTVDLKLAQELAASAPCLLAGGLDGDCVEERVRLVRPAGVDAASRLEVAPGHKDHARTHAFVSAALRALGSLT